MTEISLSLSQPAALIYLLALALHLDVVLVSQVRQRPARHPRHRRQPPVYLHRRQPPVYLHRRQPPVYLHRRQPPVYLHRRGRGLLQAQHLARRAAAVLQPCAELNFGAEAVCITHHLPPAASAASPAAGPALAACLWRPEDGAASMGGGGISVEVAAGKECGAGLRLRDARARCRKTHSVCVSGLSKGCWLLVLHGWPITTSQRPTAAEWRDGPVNTGPEHATVFECADPPTAGLHRRVLGNCREPVACGQHHGWGCNAMHAMRPGADR
jgi:hypothetical protein